jgi:hypothetical protein
MRVTIISDDGNVYVEEQALHVDLSTLDENIHAIQWYGTTGEIEYKTDYLTNTRPPNITITDFAPYQKFVDLWTAAAQAT